MTTRYLICGGRDFTDSAMLERVLDQLILHPEDAVVIHGSAKGADTLASNWGVERGCRVESYPADWAKYGGAAGPLRNQAMLDAGRPDVVIAFPGGKGTADMVRRARDRKVLVIEVTHDPYPH